MSGPGDEKPSAAEDPGSQWFEQVSGEHLEQGDLLFGFPLPAISFDEDAGELSLVRSSQAVIVVTQSCDIPKPSQTELLLASVFDFEVLRQSGDAFRSSEFRKALSRGTNISEFALPPRPAGNGQFLIVSFRKLHVVPKAYVKAHAQSEASLRLQSPYKEYFAQAYARFMMRVGLPNPLPEIR